MKIIEDGYDEYYTKEVIFTPKEFHECLGVTNKRTREWIKAGILGPDTREKKGRGNARPYRFIELYMAAVIKEILNLTHSRTLNIFTKTLLFLIEEAIKERCHELCITWDSDRKEWHGFTRDGDGCISDDKVLLNAIVSITINIDNICKSMNETINHKLKEALCPNQDA